MQNTSIQLKSKTKSRLKKFGNLSSTYDSVLNMLLDHAENCDRFWENRF